MIFKHLSEKATEFWMLTVVIIMYIALCAEADIYVPAFPQMVEYFSTTEDKIQLILSLNFMGLCVAGLVCGPLSDAFGRRKVLLTGLSGFVLTSLACFFSSHFEFMLIWRLLQGFFASVPMVIGLAVFLDRFSLEKASRMVGILNTFITGGMAGAPILGSYLTNNYGWRLNFGVISILAVLSLLGTYFFIEETLPQTKRTSFRLTSILKNYGVLLSSFKFMGYTLISLVPLVGLVVYVSNLSLIFINYLGVSADVYGYYQASTMIAFFVFSYLSSHMIQRKGLDYTKNLGGIILLIGTISLCITAIINPASGLFICMSMSLFAAGGALMLGIMGMKALDLFPEIKGASAALGTAIRQLLAAGLVMISQLTFDGTIIPTTIILSAYVLIAFIWYCLLQFSERSIMKKTLGSESQMEQHI